MEGNFTDGIGTFFLIVGFIALLSGVCGFSFDSSNGMD